jgi:hypothetical protein|nr:MAG TPA: hypothetical protein [Caudoviricetes sp.]
MPEIEGIYYETEEDYYMILDELYRDMAKLKKADTDNIG